MRNDYVSVKRILVRTTPPGFRRGLIETRDRALDLRARWRLTFGWVGGLPNFIILGTQKGGTTELYDQLILHPDVAPALAKEVHFFDANYDKGIDWYSAFFPGEPNPCPPSPFDSQAETPRTRLTGEASPCYVFHPDAARRVFSTVPNAKLIVMLRNPADRAYSHYHHEVRLGYETRPFEQAIAEEHSRLRGEKEKMQRDRHYYSDEYMHHSYLSRGIYADQLQSWYTLFPEDQILVLKSEDFFQDTIASINTVCKFLGLPIVALQKPERHKSFPYPALENNLRRRMLDYFAPHNQRLYEFLGKDFQWK